MSETDSGSPMNAVKPGGKSSTSKTNPTASTSAKKDNIDFDIADTDRVLAANVSPAGSPNPNAKASPSTSIEEFGTEGFVEEEKLEKEIFQTSENAANPKASIDANEVDGKKAYLEGKYDEAIEHWERSLRSVEFIRGKGVYEGEKLKGTKI